MEISRCRSCRAEIIWVVLAPKGRPHPVDAEPRSDGSIRIVDGPPAGLWPHRALRAYVLPIEERGPLDEPLYVSHFATCPESARWRRAG